MVAQLTCRRIVDVPGSSKGRNERLIGLTGVRSKAETDGCTIGPPDEREYAVDPVGVATIRPSDYANQRRMGIKHGLG